MPYLLALIVAVIGVIPIMRKPTYAISIGLGAFAFCSALFYGLCPTLATPLFGLLGAIVVIMWVLTAILDSATNEDKYGRSTASWTLIFPIVGIVGPILMCMSSCTAFHSSEYHDLIGQVEVRQWTQDVQPKDPTHVRLVTKELAFYLATKQLGEAPGSIGSQFEINPDSLTLQIVNGELWYVAPLDFKSYSTWSTTEGSPGYVMVHGEDPKRPIVIKTGLKMKFLDSAFFGDNLQRRLWNKYARQYVLSDYTFEVDDSGHPYWTITASHPTIMWSGTKVDGVITYDPVSGEDKFYALGSVPTWIDRVMPESIVQENLSYYESLVHGWWNTVYGHKDEMETETPEIAYGADGDPEWVTGIASTGGSYDKNKHSSLSGLMYTDVRTGKSVLYKTSGGTEESIIELVNNKVNYRKLHGSMSQIYNIYGVMTAIVPLLGESHSFQGVAFVDIANMQASEGEDVESALRAYQKQLSTSGQQVAPEKRHDLNTVTGLVSRFSAETRSGETTYYIYLANHPHIFMGSPEVSQKLRLTREGDTVIIGFIDSKEDVVPIERFDIPAINVTPTAAQVQLQERTAIRQTEVRDNRDANDARAKLQNLSDKQILELMDKK